jgi:hypothetical protein
VTVPNPGSDEAVALGCQCAVLDNAHGRGIPYPRTDGRDPNEFPSFYVNENCPLHNPEVTPETQ